MNNKPTPQYELFFDNRGELGLVVRDAYGQEHSSFTVEELYQRFKERLKEEDRNGRL